MVVPAGAAPSPPDLVAFLEARGVARYRMPENLHALKLKELTAANIGDWPVTESPT